MYFFHGTNSMLYLFCTEFDSLGINVDKTEMGIWWKRNWAFSKHGQSWFNTCLWLSGDLILGQVYPLYGTKRSEQFLQIGLPCVLWQICYSDSRRFICNQKHHSYIFSSYHCWLQQHPFSHPYTNVYYFPTLGVIIWWLLHWSPVIPLN